MLKHSMKVLILRELARAGALRWTDLVERVDGTNGNVGAAMAKLTEVGYVRKVIIAKKEVAYEITKRGRDALESYILEIL